MITPEIRYYARLEFCTQSKKTPKYKVVERAGFYEPMESQKRKDGGIYFFLGGKLKEGANVPALRLQGKNSLNFTGLKEYFQDGKLSGYAYGYPLDKPTHGKDKKINPFYEYSGDGFLFVYDIDKTIKKEIDGKNILIPLNIELIVLKGARVLIGAYCKQLQMGGFDDALAELRKQAVSPL